MKEPTLEEAKKIIEEWGIDKDNYVCVNVSQYWNGDHPDDDSIELDNYFNKCLQLVANEGLKVIR